METLLKWMIWGVALFLVASKWKMSILFNSKNGLVVIVWSGMTHTFLTITPFWERIHIPPFISGTSREELYLQLQVQVQATQVVESSQGPKKFINMIGFVGFFSDVSQHVE